MSLRRPEQLRCRRRLRSRWSGQVFLLAHRLVSDPEFAESRLMSAACIASSGRVRIASEVEVVDRGSAPRSAMLVQKNRPDNANFYRRRQHADKRVTTR